MFFRLPHPYTVPSQCIEGRGVLACSLPLPRGSQKHTWQILSPSKAQGRGGGGHLHLQEGWQHEEWKGLHLPLKWQVCISQEGRAAAPPDARGTGADSFSSHNPFRLLCHLIKHFFFMFNWSPSRSEGTGKTTLWDQVPAAPWAMSPPQHGFLIILSFIHQCRPSQIWPGPCCAGRCRYHDG